MRGGNKCTHIIRFNVTVCCFAVLHLIFTFRLLSCCLLFTAAELIPLKCQGIVLSEALIVYSWLNVLNNHLLHSLQRSSHFVVWGGPQHVGRISAHTITDCAGCCWAGLWWCWCAFACFHYLSEHFFYLNPLEVHVFNSFNHLVHLIFKNMLLLVTDIRGKMKQVQKTTQTRMKGHYICIYLFIF